MKNHAHFGACVLIPRHLNALRRFQILLTSSLARKNYRTHLALPRLAIPLVSGTLPILIHAHADFSKSTPLSRKELPVKPTKPWPALIVLLICLTSVASEATPRRVIIDTDPAVDDAMAILLALNSPELKVEALTVVAGNVGARQSLEEELKNISPAGPFQYPVATGPPHPPQQ